MADVHPKVKELLSRTYHDQRSEAWLQLREGRPQQLQAETQRIDAAADAAAEKSGDAEEFGFLLHVDLVGAAGERHDVVDSPLVVVPEKKSRSPRQLSAGARRRFRRGRGV